MIFRYPPRGVLASIATLGVFVYWAFHLGEAFWVTLAFVVGFSLALRMFIYAVDKYQDWELKRRRDKTPMLAPPEAAHLISIIPRRGKASSN